MTAVCEFLAVDPHDCRGFGPALLMAAPFLAFAALGAVSTAIVLVRLACAVSRVACQAAAAAALKALQGHRT